MQIVDKLKTLVISMVMTIVALPAFALPQAIALYRDDLDSGYLGTCGEVFGKSIDTGSIRRYVEFVSADDQPLRRRHLLATATYCKTYITAHRALVGEEGPAIARSLFEQMLEQATTFPDAYWARMAANEAVVGMALSEEQMGHSAQALFWARKVPADAHAGFGFAIAGILARQGFYKEAATYLGTSIDKAPAYGNCGSFKTALHTLSLGQAVQSSGDRESDFLDRMWLPSFMKLCGAKGIRASEPPAARAYRIRFPSGSDRRLATRSNQNLVDAMVAQIRGRRDLAVLWRLVGHSDEQCPSGTAGNPVACNTYNLDLSQRRARQLREELRQRLGRGYAIEIDAKGAQAPLEPKGWNKAHGPNRRVELKVVHTSADRPSSANALCPWELEVWDAQLQTTVNVHPDRTNTLFPEGSRYRLTYTGHGDWLHFYAFGQDGIGRMTDLAFQGEHVNVDSTRHLRRLPARENAWFRLADGQVSETITLYMAKGVVPGLSDLRRQLQLESAQGQGQGKFRAEAHGIESKSPARSSVRPNHAEGPLASPVRSKGVESLFDRVQNSGQLKPAAPPGVSTQPSGTADSPGSVDNGPTADLITTSCTFRLGANLSS